MMRFRLHRIGERLDRLPMLRALVPFAAGILLAEHWELPGWLLIVTVLLSGTLAALFRSVTAAVVLLLAAGFGTAQLHQPRRSVPHGVATRYELLVEGLPSDRGRYRTVEAVVTAWLDPVTETWVEADDRLLLYTDSLTELRSGERILGRGRIRDFRGGSASYRRLMRRRGLVGTLWIGDRTLLARTERASRTLHQRAVERLARLELPDEASALVRAMAAGDRSRLTSELRNRFSRSGFSHLLAVSGLHTGLFFGALYLLFGWMFLLRRGDRIYRFGSIAAVWLFVAAAGFPPSAIRAAILCTLLQGALFAGRPYDALHALAIAAFAMLLWQPAWLGDISFQLSFVAVFFLLTWGLPLQRRIRTRWRALNWLIALWVVSAVAGVATAPLVAHTFGMIPAAGILLNPLALLPAAVIVLCGTLWIAVPAAWLAPPVTWILRHAAALLDTVTRWAESLPGSCLTWQPSTTGMVLIYALLLAATLAGWGLESPEPPRTGR